jgi:HSP20 family protein
MTRKTSDIFSQFDHIHEQLDRAYRNLIGSPGSPGFGSPFMEPAADVYETDDEVVVQVEMAGIHGEQVEVQVNGKTLLLRGERKPLAGRPRRRYSQLEISHGWFQRELELPSEVDASKAEATYREGILEISMPKAAPKPGGHLRIVVHQ